MRISVGAEDTWRSSSPVGGGSYLKLELLKSGTTSRSPRTEFINMEPVPVAVDLDGDGVEEIVVPQNQLDGHLGILFRGPAGYRFQSINSGFEGVITALGAIPGDNPPALVVAVVRFTTFLRRRRGHAGPCRGVRPVVVPPGAPVAAAEVLGPV